MLSNDAIKAFPYIPCKCNPIPAASVIPVIELSFGMKARVIFEASPEGSTGMARIDLGLGFNPTWL